MPIAMLLAAVLAAPFGISTTSATTTAHVRHHSPHRRVVRRPDHYGISRGMMAEVRRVNVCEEGGDWHVNGPEYFGGLGWLAATWAEFREHAWPSDMADAPPYMQANAMFRFVWHYGIAMPDQAGCTGSY